MTRATFIDQIVKTYAQKWNCSPYRTALIKARDRVQCVAGYRRGGEHHHAAEYLTQAGEFRRYAAAEKGKPS